MLLHGCVHESQQRGTRGQKSIDRIVSRRVVHVVTVTWRHLSRSFYAHFWLPVLCVLPAGGGEDTLAELFPKVGVAKSPLQTSRHQMAADFGWRREGQLPYLSGGFSVGCIGSSFLPGGVRRLPLSASALHR